MRFATIALLLAVGCAAGPTTEQQLRERFEQAQLAVRRGEFSRAQELIDGALESRPRESASASEWHLRLLLAEIFLDRLEPSRAAPILTAEIPGGPAFDAVRARQRYLQSRAQVAEGKLTDSLVTLDAAQRLAPNAEDLQLDAEILGGQIRLRLGEWETARQRLEAVVRRTGETGDRHRQAVALNTLGMGHLIRSRYDEAASWFERALALPGLNGTGIYAAALSNAGICYSRVGQFERAKALQEQAVQIYDRGGPSRLLVESLGSLGNTYVLNGDARTSISFLRRAMDAAISANLTAESALWAGNLAKAHASLSQWNEATHFNNEAKKLAAAAGSRSVRPVYFTLNAAEISAGRGEHAEAERLFTDALAAAEGIPSVVWSAHAGLAGTAMAVAQPERAARHFEAALETIEKTRSSLLKTEFRLSFLTQLIEFYQSYVDALVSQNRIERALEITESSRARVLAERHGVQSTLKADALTLRKVARQSGAIFLSYWLSRGRSSMWIISAEGVRHHPLPPATEIDALVRQHQAMIHNTLANPLGDGTPGDRLYELLIAPAARLIKPGAPVFVVPDGALHRLNFETLVVTEGRTRYWIEDAEIQIAPSLMTLATRDAARAGEPTLLLIGDAAGREPEFPALRYASAEMDGISRHFPASRVNAHRGPRAVPGAYRDARLDQFSMIHFTAHAVANTESPLDSAIMLSGPDHGFKLYARDVADRPLNADLVTVSACRSAGERTYSGEGLVGFAWAFLRAGARRVIAGLWDVDDRSTADLMDHVYAGIASGRPAPRALREAKLALLRKGGTTARPYYWAPFEVFTATVN